MRWGPGDQYVSRGASSQPRALKLAILGVQECRWRDWIGAVGTHCGAESFRGMHCCAWKVGHHAGRIFAMREKARETNE